MTRNKGALWREESVMQVMAFSVNGVSMDEDGNGEGQGHVRHAGVHCTCSWSKTNLVSAKEALHVILLLLCTSNVGLLARVE